MRLEEGPCFILVFVQLAGLGIILRSSVHAYSSPDSCQEGKKQAAQEHSVILTQTPLNVLESQNFGPRSNVPRESHTQTGPHRCLRGSRQTWWGEWRARQHCDRSVQLSPGLWAVLPGFLNSLAMPANRVDFQESFGDASVLPIGTPLSERGREKKPVCGSHFHFLGTSADVLSD